MESPEKRLPISTERINQCRICLKSSRTQNKLTEELKKKFLDVTQTELQENDKLSCFLCPKCAKALNNAHSYRQELIETQKELLREVSNALLSELIDLKQEKVDDFDEIIIDECLEQEIQIKQELNDSKNMDFDENLLDSYAFAESLPIEDQEVKKRVRKKEIFKCDFEGCNEEIKGKRPYNIHRRQHEPPAVKKIVPKKKSQPFICPICGVFRCHKVSLQKHIDAVHKKLKNYFCDLCGYSGCLRNSMICHMRNNHMDPSQRKIYYCDQCDFQSLYPIKLKTHISYDHLGLAVACHCGKLFKNKYALQIHINIAHLKLKKHACDICDKKFYGLTDLNDHITIAHTENKVFKFSCTECGKQFYTRKQLMRHVEYHKEVKFACTEPGCDKAYTNQKKLAKHMKIHSGQRDLICHLCDKSYFFTRDLQRHLDVVHKQTTYYCPLCSVTNNRKDYLDNHIKSAHKHISKEERSKMLKTVKFTKNPV